MAVLHVARSAVLTNSLTNQEWDTKIVLDIQVELTYDPVILYNSVYK